MRDDVGTISQTDFGYTFQRNLPDIGLMDYKARFYDPGISKFAQPDTIIPNLYNPQSLNRYSYANNNPIKYTDPSGHCIEIEEGLCAHLGEKKNTYHISAPFRNRFNGDFEADAGAFIITGDPEALRYSDYGAGFMAGAAIENACNVLGKDCGNYYNTVFTVLTAMTGAFGGAYPPTGIGPGSSPNVAMPNSVRSDLGDPDCPGCGYSWDLSASMVPGGDPQITVLGFKEDVAFYTDVNVNTLYNQPYYNWGMNEQFLKAGMYRGDTFYYASNYDLGLRRLFAREVYFLKNANYPNIIDLFHP